MLVYIGLGVLSGAGAYALTVAWQAAARSLSDWESARSRNDDRPILGCEPGGCAQPLPTPEVRCGCGANLDGPLRVAQAFALRDAFCPACRTWRKVN